MSLKIKDDNPKWYARQILCDLITALNWIADGHDDKEGMDLIVRPMRAKYNLDTQQKEGGE